jgi:hypothetical protein
LDRNSPITQEDSAFVLYTVPGEVAATLGNRHCYQQSLRAITVVTNNSETSNRSTTNSYGQQCLDQQIIIQRPVLIRATVLGSNDSIERQRFGPAIVRWSTMFESIISIKPPVLIRATVSDSTTIINGNSWGNNIEQQWYR